MRHACTDVKSPAECKRAVQETYPTIKKVPSDLMTSPPITGMQRYELPNRKRRTFRLSAPLKPGFPNFRINASWLAAASSSAQGRQLVTAFRSPATTPALTNAIPGSKFLACHFAASQLASPPGPPFCSAAELRFAPVSGRFVAFWPVAVPPVASTGCFPGLHFPSGVLAPPDQSVQPVPLPVGPPLRFARFPFAPRCRSFSSVATDHRSRSATFPKACCSSNLLEPSSL